MYVSFITITIIITRSTIGCITSLDRPLRRRSESAIPATGQDVPGIANDNFDHIDNFDHDDNFDHNENFDQDDNFDHNDNFDHDDDFDHDDYGDNDDYSDDGFDYENNCDCIEQ